MRYKRRLTQTAGPRVRLLDPARSREIVKKVLERSAAKAPLIFPQETPAPKLEPELPEHRPDTSGVSPKSSN